MSSNTAAEPSDVPKKGKKKAKGKKMALQDFLGDASSGTNFIKDPPKLTGPSNSWADSMEDIDPSEISTNWPEEEKMFDRSVLPSGPKASAAMKIDKSRLPSSPPYTVYLGNLSFESTEEDIIRFFGRKKLVASSVRLPLENGTNRMRGFGYAEFETLNDLMEALTLDKEMMRNRSIQVDIAGGKGGGGDNFGGRGQRDYGADDRTTGDWRKGDSDGPTSPMRREYDRDSYGGADRRYGRGGYGNRGDYRDSYNRDDYGSGRRDDYGGGRRDDYGGRRDYRGGYDRGAPRSRGFGQGWQGGDRSDSYRGGREDRYGDRRGYGGHGSPEHRREEPMERPRIKLAPRTKPLENTTSAGLEEKSGSASIFGGAKPVDTASREREIEERLVEKEQQEKEAEKERQEKTASVFGGAKPVDTAAREREIEEKLARENEVIERKLLEDRSPERSGNRQYEHRNRTAEDGERSRDRREGSYDRRDDYDNRGSRGRRRHYSSEEEGRRGPERRGYNDDEGGTKEREKGDRANDERPANDKGETEGGRSSRERGDGEDGWGRDDRQRRGGGRGRDRRDSDRRDYRRDDRRDSDRRDYRRDDRRDSDHRDDRRNDRRDDRRDYRRDDRRDDRRDSDHRDDRKNDRRDDRRDYRRDDRRDSDHRDDRRDSDHRDDRRDSDRRDDRRDSDRRDDRRDSDRRDDRRDSDHRDDRRDYRRDDRRDSDRRDDRKAYSERRDYHGDRGGRGRGRGRSRDDRRDDDKGGRERGGKPPSNAWSKGKPRSLGGADAEPVVFSQPSRYATLQDEADSGSGDEGQRSLSPVAQES